MVKIAVVGASSNLGREILSFLSEGGFEASEIVALEPKSPMGTMVSYGEDDELDVLNLDEFDFSKADVSLFACTLETAKKYLMKAHRTNTKIVDCTGATDCETNVPMIVAGVNDSLLKDKQINIAAIPNPIVTQLLKPLAKVSEKYKIERIVLSAYLSASFHSREAMDELFAQTRKIYMNTPFSDNEEIFKKQIAFNVLPQVGEFIGEETSTEWQINAEVKKILGPNVKVHANLAYVPAFIGAGLFVNVETSKDVDVNDVRTAIGQTEGVVVFDKPLDGGYVSLSDVQSETDIYVSRLRQDVSTPNGFSFWCVADNLRASSAKNAYDVMKLMLK